MLAGSIKNENTFTYILSYCFKSERDATNPKLGSEPLHAPLGPTEGCHRHTEASPRQGLYLPSSPLKGQEVIYIKINPLETSANLTIRVFKFFFSPCSHKL